MHKAKHSKFRNTGILLELLTRQVTSDILAGKDESIAKDLLFKYFSPNTDLGKEWQLYNFLVNETAKDDAQAEKYIAATIKQREKIDNKNLFKQKYALINEINKTYSSEMLLRSNLKNYKLFASIYKIFENSIATTIKFDVREIVQARNCIADNLCGKKSNDKSNDTSDSAVKLFTEQTEDIRLLTYKIMVDSLNEKYNGLNEKQKLLLREFINNVANTNSLNVLIENEVKAVQSELDILTEQIQSDVVRIKIKEISHQLNRIKNIKAIKENHVMVLLLSYELIKEIKSKLL